MANPSSAHGIPGQRSVLSGLLWSSAQSIRPARQTDLAAIQELLAPLEQAGITKKRFRRELSADIPFFAVIEPR